MGQSGRVFVEVGVLEKKGMPIGAHDILIAAHARALDAVCVTTRWPSSSGYPL